MKKLAKELKRGDKINIFGKEAVVEEIEFSDIGKQGKKKARIVAETNGEKVVMVRPEDYPFDVK